MKKIIVPILKVIIPLGLGVFLILLVYNQLTPKQFEEAKRGLYETDKFYLLLSIFLGLLSHASRAWRWKYPLQALGFQPKFWNSFFTVMMGYLANMGIPRSGEVLRCGAMSKYENIPFNKLVGTVIAERVADFVILVGSILVAIYLQSDVILGLLPSVENLLTPGKIAIFSGVIVLGIVGVVVLAKSKSNFLQKVKEFMVGILEGVKTIFTMEKKWLFIAHTVFIWLMYYAMFHVTFYGLPELSIVPVSGIFTSFIAGGLGIAFTNGGIGAYPAAIRLVLNIYDLKDIGYGFGWAVWTAQSLMLIGGGLISFLLIPRFNSKSK